MAETFLHTDLLAQLRENLERIKRRDTHPDGCPEQHGSGDDTCQARYAADGLALLDANAVRPEAWTCPGCKGFSKRCADALADEVAVLVRRKVIDARSPAGDALLDYRDPPSMPRADRLAELDEIRAELVALRGLLDRSLKAARVLATMTRVSGLQEGRAVADELVADLEKALGVEQGVHRG